MNLLAFFRTDLIVCPKCTRVLSIKERFSFKYTEIITGMTSCPCTTRKVFDAPLDPRAALETEMASIHARIQDLAFNYRGKAAHYKGEFGALPEKIKDLRIDIRMPRENLKHPGLRIGVTPKTRKLFDG